MHIDELISWLDAGRIRLDDIITHVLSLEEAPHNYSIYNEKQDICVKVVLKPGQRHNTVVGRVIGRRTIKRA